MEQRQPVPIVRSNAIVVDGAAHDDFGGLAAPMDPPSDWGRYLVAIVRHKWIVLAVTLVGTVAGVIGSRYLDPLYSAKATLWVESGERAKADPHLISAQDLVPTSSWTTLVTSSAVLDTVVRSLRLYLSAHGPVDRAAFADLQIRPGLQPGPYVLVVDRRGTGMSLMLEDGTVVQEAAVGSTVGSAVGFTWTPPLRALTPGRRIEFTVSAPSDAVQDLGKNLMVRLDPGGSFLGLELKGVSPSLTAATVNAVAQRTVVVAADLKRQKFEELARILSGQYGQAQRALRDAETGLSDFRVRTAGRFPEDATGGTTPAGRQQDGAPPTAYNLRVQLDQIHRDRRAIEQVLHDTSSAGRWVDALGMIGAVQHSPPLIGALKEVTDREAALRALRYRYTEESAPVLQARSDLANLQERAVPALARRLVNELAVQETELAERSDSAFRSVRLVPPLVLEEARLRRDVTNAEELSTNVGQRLESARLALASSLPDIRLLDAAVSPRRAATDPVPLCILASFLGSLCLALVGVTVHDGVDPRVHYPEQVTRDLRLPIMGALPHVSWRRSPVGHGGLAEVIEVFRGLRVRVLHAVSGGGPLFLTITSPEGGEGKSFVSVNLALSFAYAGYGTLLIDGDVRRGAQYQVLGCSQRPGLTDVLASSVSGLAAVQKTQYADLSFLSAGTATHRAPELLLSSRLKDLVHQLRGVYDVVIIDSPPLMAGVDPLVLGTVTENLLLVLRSGTTDLPLAAAKLSFADTLPIRTIGAVLNDVRGRGAFRKYGYDLTGYEQLEGGSQLPGWRNVLGGRS